MAKVRQIIALHTQGVSKQKISELTGASRNTVKKYLRIYKRDELRWGDIEKMSDYALTAKAGQTDHLRPEQTDH